MTDAERERILESIRKSRRSPMHRANKPVVEQREPEVVGDVAPAEPVPTSQPEFSFRKVDGEWLVRVWDGPGVQTGHTVEVPKRDGSSTTVKLGQLHPDSSLKVKLFHVEREPRQQRRENPEPEAGMYRLEDGTIVRVYLGQKSGRMLAKQLVSDGDHHEYEYMGAARRFITTETAKLTLEEAKEFGRMTGHCCVCARRLDVPESVEAGIGPVCASRLA